MVNLLKTCDLFLKPLKLSLILQCILKELKVAKDEESWFLLDIDLSVIQLLWGEKTPHILVFVSTKICIACKCYCIVSLTKEMHYMTVIQLHASLRGGKAESCDLKFI